METMMSLATLTLLEIVLGIDNIIFISILAGKLQGNEKRLARQLGLMGALVTRLGLLATMAWIAQLTTPLFDAFGVPISGKSLILILGGVFLIFKATHEIHDKLEGDESPSDAQLKRNTLPWTIAQIMVIDIVFSLDSVITAVGMSNQLGVMVLANVIALGIMLVASGSISDFVDRHPTITTVRHMSSKRSMPKIKPRLSGGIPNCCKRTITRGSNPPGTPAVPTPARTAMPTTVICCVKSKSTPDNCAKNNTVTPSKRAVPF
ncbi:MAG: TerC family protein [Proteobacteria bacterium]|nr:TerC family protein [Pseudomonadota bacterium]